MESSLFIGNDTLLSKEGTTQGDPLAMVMYAVASIPLIHDLSSISEVKQLWYADDATGMGSLKGLRSWWDRINELGRYYGYWPNAVKSSLLVSSDRYDEACEVFKDTNVSVNCKGVTVLGSPVGSTEFVQSEINNKISLWCEKLKLLSGIARSQPQSAYSAFTHGLFGEWSYIFRTCQVEDHNVQPLEDCIRQVLIPSILGREAVNDIERTWLSLPTRYGGLGLYNPISFNISQHCCSVDITKPLVELLRSNEKSLPLEVEEEIVKLKKNCVKQKEVEYEDLWTEVKSNLPSDRLRLLEAATERGTSTWLTALPLKEYGFNLNKEEFRDALCLRYGWRPSDLPLTCVCGESFSVSHSLMCVHGGLITRRHNDIRDLSASLLKDVCSNVCKEPTLQPLTGESLQHRSASTDDGARLDVSAEGFWGNRYQRAFFDVRVFCPLSSYYQSKSLQQCYKDNEALKKRKYEQRVREVEHGCFSPLIFSTSGGCGPVSTLFIKRLAILHSEKFQRPYSATINFIRCRYSFAILKSALRCLRGSRSKMRLFDSNDFSRAISDAHLSLS